MPLLNNKCGNCHTPVLGREKSMTNFKNSTASYAEHCSKEKRTRKIDRGKMIEHLTEKRNIARCPVCGRKKKLEWFTTKKEKEWKDGGCD